MNRDTLTRQFGAIGADLKISLSDGFPRGRVRVASDPGASALDGFKIDIGERKGREVFELSVRPDAVNELEIIAIDVRPKMRHLLLLARPVSGQIRSKQNLLCGHDERHWFVASAPGDGVTRVEQAMHALKPVAARASQIRNGVKNRDLNSRHNAGFLRQGEWFFVPAPEFAPPSDLMILRNEPIRRGRSKPHLVERLYRSGGVKVYVNHKFPNGLTEAEYSRLLLRSPQALSLRWTTMMRNPSVYAIGKVRHPDHATLVLPIWHRVLMSLEESAVSVAFLD